MAAIADVAILRCQRYWRPVGSVDVAFEIVRRHKLTPAKTILLIHCGVAPAISAA
jgi:hypothetical protein